MKILFLHGWRSVPGGLKPAFLISQGCEVINPALNDDDFAAALNTAQNQYDSQRPHVIVGSSRGGAVALNIDSGETPLVLLCPAWKRWGSASRLKRNALILHSRLDDVIPFSDSEELVALSELPDEVLIEVGIDHRLADDESLSVMMWACRVLASGKPLPWLDDSSLSNSGSPDDSARTLRRTSQAEAAYLCDSCGEEIVIPVDVSEGCSQVYVEDCPVCCRANRISILIETDGTILIQAEPEQDYD